MIRRVPIARSSVGLARRSLLARFARSSIAAVALLSLAATARAEPRRVVLWHSYREAEAQALQQVVDAFNAAHPDVQIVSLPQPNDVLADKVSTAIPQDNGPDVFIFAHERIGGWVEAGLLSPLENRLAPDEWSAFVPETVPPLQYGGHTWGAPLAFKSLALFYDKALVPAPPKTTDEMLRLARAISHDGTFGIGYPASEPFFVAPWYFGFGAPLFEPDGKIGFDRPEAVRALAFAAKLHDEGLMPEEASGALVTKLFNEKHLGMVVNGPWFVGEIDKKLDWSVAPMPIVSETGLPAKPFLTDEAVFVSAKAHSPDDALAVVRWLTSRDSAITRGVVGRQVVATKAAWDDPRLANDPVLGAFRAQLPATVPMDNRPLMQTFWEPAKLAIQKVLRGDATPEQAARAAVRRHAAIARAPMTPEDPRPFELVAALVAIVGLALLVRRARRLEARDARAAGSAWRWIAPAAVATGILVFLPFAVGLVLSLFEHRGNSWSFVGLANFVDILAARSYAPTEPLSFYYALVVTILWTAVNVVLHLVLGLALALLLNRPLLSLKPIYRVLLIVPWAVPNYITALIWKGLFHKQFGAINGMLRLLGFHGVAWFSSFPTAFFANVCTNAWLGFPFMMVVALGALQSIPKDLYEAADVDGAGALAKLRHVTLPLLMPAMVPALLLGTVWTFNQFNIVYLVSGGEPDNSTDILISEAYRWAFVRQQQYGYAAAYAVLIFALLLAWSLVSARVAKVAEAVRG